MLKVMSEIKLIEGVLKRAGHRRRVERAWRFFWKGLFVGAVLWFVLFGVFKLAPIPGIYLTLAAGCSALVPIFAALYGACKRVDVQETARWVDSQKKLHERLSTALEISASPGSSEWKQLVLSDAAQHAQDIDPSTLLPFRFPRIGRWAFMALALAAVLAFVPPLRSKAYVRKQNDIANIKDTGKKLTEF